MPRTRGPSEKQFQAQVVQLARHCNWSVYHTHDSRRSAKGFPDLVLVHPRRGVLWVELKSATGKPTAEQTRWLALLNEAGQRAFLWRPSDWSEIQEALTHEHF